LDKYKRLAWYGATMADRHMGIIRRSNKPLSLSVITL
jgi:hypothetical protein